MPKGFVQRYVGLRYSVVKRRALTELDCGSTKEQSKSKSGESSEHHMTNRTSGGHYGEDQDAKQNLVKNHDIIV